MEGATPGARNIATDEGHSRDTTLATLNDFKATEDPDDKLQIVTRDGYWREKDEMSQAYAERATGDYLWQVDVDEFYMPADIEAVLHLLRTEPGITAVSFNTITFWGAPEYHVDSWYLRRGAAEYHRLFKWGAGYRYVSHRPPTVIDNKGRDLRSKTWKRAGSWKRVAFACTTIPCCCPSKCWRSATITARPNGRSASTRWIGRATAICRWSVPITCIMWTTFPAVCFAIAARTRRR